VDPRELRERYGRYWADHVKEFGHNMKPHDVEELEELKGFVKRSMEEMGLHRRGLWLGPHSGEWMRELKPLFEGMETLDVSKERLDSHRDRIRRIGSGEGIREAEIGV
jgi:hypothetical protein